MWYLVLYLTLTSPYTGGEVNYKQYVDTFTYQKTCNQAKVQKWVNYKEEPYTKLQDIQCIKSDKV